MQNKIIIGTRGSELALWQANYTVELLKAQGREAEIKIIKTQGDQIQDLSFDKMEGKGFFTKEIEEALLRREIDIAVHSHKDLPTESPEGLIIAAVSEREDASELILIRKESVDEKQKFRIKQGAIFGTSSARRKSQLLSFRPDLEIKELRGNVPTRIKKLSDGNYDAIMVASAGVERLQINLEDFVVEKTSPQVIVPAPAQGVLAWQIREDDLDLIYLLENINCEDVETCIKLERQVLNKLDGGCQLPLGVYCEIDVNINDRRIFRVWVSKAESWNKLPKRLYFESGFTEGLADKILEKLNTEQPKKVFITRMIKEQDFLFSTLKNFGYQLNYASLIEFKEVKIPRVPFSEWIFFSSKHAVKYFFNQNPTIGKVKFGCVGKETSHELRQFGQRADFIGQSTDTKLVGKQFSSLVGGARVVFPMAKDSLQSIQMQMVKRENAINLPVYETIKHKVEIPDCDVVIFTSPSNVDGYFENKKWQPNQIAIAMGEATEGALIRKKVYKSTKLMSFDDLGMVQAVLGL